MLISHMIGLSAFSKPTLKRDFMKWIGEVMQNRINLKNLNWNKTVGTVKKRPLPTLHLHNS